VRILICSALIFFLMGCGGGKPERVYYPVMEDMLVVVDIVTTDGGVPYKCPDDVKQFDPIDTSELDASLPPGIIVNECQFAAENIYATQEARRLKKEAKIIKEVARKQQKAINATEKAYQDKIYDLEEKSKRTWMEENGGYIWFGVGVAAAILVFLIVDTAEDLDQ